MTVAAITIVDGFHYRYLVQTGIVRAIANECEHVYVFCDQTFSNRLDAESIKNLDVVVLKEKKLSVLQNVFLFMRNCESIALSETQNLKSETQMRRNKLKFVAKLIFRKLYARYNLKLSKFLEWVWKDREIALFFDEQKVDVLITSTPGQKLDDISFIAEAQRKKIKTISPVYSWDNLTAKGPFALNPNKLIVWNEPMQAEAIKFHGYDKDTVLVCGVPVFDGYREILDSPEKFAKRTLLENFGWHENLPLVTVATIPRVYYGSGHREIVSFLKQCRSRGGLGNFYILIRPHPLDTTDYSDLVDSYTAVDTYGSRVQANPKNWMPNDNIVTHLGITMLSSDVVINIASTITIDAPCFDTPVINVAFDALSDDYEKPVSRYYGYTHYKYVVETGAPDIVYSFEEMEESLRSYFFDPLKNSFERTKLVDLMVGSFDGTSWSKISTSIVAFARS